MEGGFLNFSRISNKKITELTNSVLIAKGKVSVTNCVHAMMRAHAVIISFHLILAA